MSGRIEVVARVFGRRRWTVEQKFSILRNAFGPSGSVRDAVERHEVGSGQLYT
jgi:transposase